MLSSSTPFKIHDENSHLGGTVKRSGKPLGLQPSALKPNRTDDTPLKPGTLDKSALKPRKALSVISNSEINARGASTPSVVKHNNLKISKTVEKHVESLIIQTEFKTKDSSAIKSDKIASFKPKVNFSQEINAGLPFEEDDMICSRKTVTLDPYDWVNQTQISSAVLANYAGEVRSAPIIEDPVIFTDIDFVEEQNVLMGPPAQLCEEHY